MEKVTLESLSILKEAGHQVELFSLHPVGDLMPLAESCGIQLKGVARYRWGGLGNLPDILQAVKKARPDRLWLVGHNFGALVAAKLTNCPSYLSIHYHHCERPIGLWKVFYGLAKRCTRSIHFASEYIYEEVSALFSPKNRTCCIPNVFPPPPELLNKQQVRSALDIPADAFVVGNAGWLISRKAFDVFLHVAERISKREPTAFFIIAGDGEERASLEALTAQLGIEDKVRFLGWQQNLLPFFSSIDLVLFNSNFDALGRTPVEALSYGIPVVASVTNGGLKEFIRHGVDGFLLDRHDVDALADEVLRMYGDADYSNRMADSGRRRVLELGSPARHLEQLKCFLEL